MEFLELAKRRYSCRNISEKAVEPEKIQKILEAGTAAPTACNMQPIKIWVIEKDEDIEKIKEVTSCTFGARLFFVVGGRKDQGWVRKFDGREFADVDAAIAATHMMLEIEDSGLASTWVANFDSCRLKKLFPDMEEYDLIAIFPVGYAEETAKPSDRHSQRKSLEEIAVRL
ncbi:MAG: nitroreductase family protein [Porcipelethomonas sp.]